MNPVGFTDRKVQGLKYKPENSLSLFIATATPIIPVGDFSNFFGRLVFLERKEKNSLLFSSIAFYCKSMLEMRNHWINKFPVYLYRCLSEAFIPCLPNSLLGGLRLPESLLAELPLLVDLLCDLWLPDGAL